jgi:hypothetical protein
MLVLAIVNVATTASPVFNNWVHGIGKLWMPGAEGIGPYSGKETLSLLAWLVTWAVLHVVLPAQAPPVAVACRVLGWRRCGDDLDLAASVRAGWPLSPAVIPVVIMVLAARIADACRRRPATEDASEPLTRA